MWFDKFKYLNFEDVKSIRQYYELKLTEKIEKSISSKNENEKLQLQLENQSERNEMLMASNEDLIEELNTFEEDVKSMNYSEIDDYLVFKHKLVKDEIYTDKREIKGKSIPIRINDMIQPDVYAIESFMSKFRLNGDVLKNIKLVANNIASWQWTSDRYNYGKEDQYATVSEILTLKKDDCESMCHVLTSCFPKQIGIAYGISTYGDIESYGHAWCKFVYKNELYVADCWLGDNALVDKWENVKHLYEPYLIYTKRATYRIKNGNFGKRQ